MKEKRNIRFAFVKDAVKYFPEITRTHFLRRNTRFSGFRVTSLRVIPNLFTSISSQIEEALVVRRVIPTIKMEITIAMGNSSSTGWRKPGRRVRLDTIYVSMYSNSRNRDLNHPLVPWF